MSSNVNELRVFESVVGTLNTYAAQHLTAQSQDGRIKSFSKLIAGLVSYPVIAVAGLVETVVRNLILLLAKTLQFFIPKQWSEKFDIKILVPLYNHAATTTAHTLDALTKVVTNLLSKHTQINTSEKIFESMENLYTSTFMLGFMNLHINGFAIEEEAPKPIVTPPPPPQEKPVKKEGWIDWAKAKLINGVRYFVPAR